MNTSIEQDSKLDHARMVIQEETLIFASREMFVVTSSPNTTVFKRYFNLNLMRRKTTTRNKEKPFKSFILSSYLSHRLSLRGSLFENTKIVTYVVRVLAETTKIRTNLQ